MTLLHGTCILVAGAGVLLRGASSSGKSDLAFRLIEAGEATLISDDQTDLTVRNARLLASPPAQLAGLIEVRGLGILTRAHGEACPVDLVVELVERAEVPRMPYPQTIEIETVSLPCYRLCAFDASAPAKVAALARQHRQPGGGRHA